MSFRSPSFAWHYVMHDDLAVKLHDIQLLKEV